VDKNKKLGRPRKEKPIEVPLILDNMQRMPMSIRDFARDGTPRYNMAAGISATSVGIKKERVRSAVNSFQHTRHRMQHVATISGVDFYNDSKSTNVNSTWFALESVDSRVILILGGVDKSNDYSVLQDLVKQKVRAIICMGIDNKKIHHAFADTVKIIVDTHCAAEAVNTAFKLAAKGDTVLLSPACASFDLFKNYEDRGNRFIAAVKEL
jgi:UDP-N-acetylmuramoylalanine--D-glutamate ligase